MPTVAIWCIAPQDFGAWRDLTGFSEVADYAQWTAMLDQAVAGCQRQGAQPSLVQMPVADMRDRLAKAALENTAGNRARVAAESLNYILGVKIGIEGNKHPSNEATGYIGWAIVGLSATTIASGTAASVDQALQAMRERLDAGGGQ
jgi:hypothetical protein